VTVTYVTLMFFCSKINIFGARSIILFLNESTYVYAPNKNIFWILESMFSGQISTFIAILTHFSATVFENLNQVSSILILFLYFRDLDTLV